MRKQLAIAVAATVLTACGGGGGGSSTPPPPPPPPPPTNAAVDGIWESSYTNSAGNAADSVIFATADGNYLSIGVDTVTKCQGIGYGTLVSDANNLTLSGIVDLVPCTFADGASTATISGSGTIQAATSISLTTLTLESSMNDSYPADWLGGSMSFDALYNEASSFAKVAGTYNVTDNGAVLGMITVAGDGTLTYGPDTNGCSASGSLSIIDAQHAIMGATISFVNCGAALGAGMTGDAVLVDTVNPVEFLAIVKNSTAVGVMVGTQ
jgi:hypothetical protein